MILLLKPEEFAEKTSRAPIPLECQACHNVFHRPKNRVQAVIKGAGKYKNKFKFCSDLCFRTVHIKVIQIECFRCHKSIKRLPADILDRNFCSKKCSAQHYGDLRRKPKAIKIPKPLLPHFHKNCSFCSGDLLRSQKEIDNSKTKTFFCNKSCKTQYLHKFQIIHKPRSRAEKYLANLIKMDFPNLLMQENIRTVLSNNLEIDIYFPTLKLAIELNGPVHYLPIFGQEKLTQVQNKDIKKQIELQKLGLNLIIIDISKLNSIKKTEVFLDAYFLSHIKPLIDLQIGASQGS